MPPPIKRSGKQAPHAASPAASPARASGGGGGGSSGGGSGGGGSGGGVLMRGVAGVNASAVSDDPFTDAAIEEALGGDPGAGWEVVAPKRSAKVVA